MACSASSQRNNNLFVTLSPFTQMEGHTWQGMRAEQVQFSTRKQENGEVLCVTYPNQF